MAIRRRRGAHRGPRDPAAAYEDVCTKDTHQITPHDMAEYVNEMVWREEVRRDPRRNKLEMLLKKLLRSGRSRWWRGDWQGMHRPGDLEATG